MNIKSFEDLICWQKAQDLSVSIYTTFRQNKDWSFKDQIQRASVSISNNIAEGSERTSKEFLRFLSIAKSSCNEVKPLLFLAFKLNYINEIEKITLINDSTEVSKIIQGLKNSIEKNID